MPVAEPVYPVNLLVAGRRCLVVGGGPVAARKAAGLAACGAVVHVVATEVGPEVRALDGVSWEQRPYRPGDVAGYRLVVTATGVSDVDAVVSADADAAGIWVNSADDPANCTFILPAVVRRGPVVVAVSTSGRSPALAAWLKERLAGEVGPEYEVLAALLSEERDAVRAEGRSTEDLDWRSALDSDMLELIRSGRLQQAKERLQACLSSS
ncbi:MAG TPA: bifunctional precorrin-2 dehydrogenase/sirohydrochlorin ferrochelatase [Acidimicrobiales bacterium]|nr:bifunctional precorrin-2 dehydrogenase/sirohydrochlorin ferrochelatase [Acidimicrobiales bacterium]